MRRLPKALQISSLALLLVLVQFAPSSAYDASYVSADQLNLSKVLPLPPASNSDQQKADLAAVLKAQETRTPEQADRAVKDNSTSLFRIADGLFGEAFTAERLPKLTAFHARVIADTVAIFLASKEFWDRPRPYAVSAEVKSIGERPTSASYPSGHTTRGQITAIILANMVPEKAEQIFARGREYGENRVVAGVHFPTDIEAGRLSATAIASVLMLNERFSADFNEAKAELRQVLGLAPSK